MGAYPFSLGQGGAQTPTVYPAAVNASSSGNNTVIAAVAGKRIVVYQEMLVAASAVTATWESSGGTLLSGPLPLAASGGYESPYTECGHFSTLVGEGLVLNLGTGVAVGGYLLYALV